MKSPLEGAGRLRVAIVGFGPKGLFALERLLDHAERVGAFGRLAVDLYEPHPAPAAGPVYDPGQPGYLRMNFAADAVDMWWRETGEVDDRKGGERRSFVEWRAARGAREVVEEEEEAYPSRAAVGRYLCDGFDLMLQAAEAEVPITIRPTEVCSVRRVGSVWRVGDGSGLERDHDEVLITVGHELGSRTRRNGAWRHSARLVPHVFPVATMLTEDRVPPGSAVAMRGFALTFLDAALALTEGRGGTFERISSNPFRLRYLPSERDVRVIVPFSRTGRPMLAKPDPRMVAVDPRSHEVSRAGRQSILGLPAETSIEADLLPILAATATEILGVAAGRPADEGRSATTRRMAEEWLMTAAAGGTIPAESGPVEEIERSLAVGSGLLSPDLPWALGQTWRVLYPAAVERLGGSGLSDDAWPPFRRLAVEMERISFGPPPVNAAKLLALVAAGRIDLSCVAGGRLVERGSISVVRADAGERPVELIVDAVLPSPGALGRAGLLRQLLVDGHARVMGGRRGLEIATDGGCIGRGGERTPGLSALGRPTEDCVIGNDTLSRRLHPQGDAWAGGVAKRAAAGLVFERGSRQQPATGVIPR